MLCLLASSAFARDWQGASPGKSTKAELLQLFGEPQKVVPTSSGEILAYVGARSISGTRQVQFHLDGERLKRIDVFPLAIIDRSTAIDTWGPKCAPASSASKKAATRCYTEKLVGGTRPYLHYVAEGVAVFFTPDGARVESVAYLPDPAEAARLRAANTSATGRSGSDADKAAEDEAWGAVSSIAPTSSGSDAPVVGPQLPSGLELGGTVKAEHHSYFRRFAEPKVAGRDAVELELAATGRLGHGKGHAELAVRKDLIDPSRDRLELDEGYVAVDAAPLRLSAGLEKVQWGTADLANPTDVLNPRDYSDLLFPEKRSAWMLRADLSFEIFGLEAYLLPVPAAHRLPAVAMAPDGELLSASPWIDGSVADPSAPVPLRYQLVAAPAFRPGIESLEGAARLKLRLLGADLSLGYAYLHDRFPQVATEVGPFDPVAGEAVVTLSLLHRRQHVATADLERAFGRFRIAAEGALFLYAQEDAGLERSGWVQYVAGADYQTGQFLIDHYVHFFAAFLDTVAVEGALPDDVIGRLRYPLKRAALARVEYHAGRAWAAKVSAFSAVDRLDLVLRPELVFSFADGLDASLSGVILLGSSGGFFGDFQRLSRAEVSFAATF